MAEATLRGEVKRRVFSAGEDGFAVLRVITPKGAETVVGQGLNLKEGEEAVFTGEWKDHPRFGRQFVVSSYTPLTPESLDGIRRFLSSGLVKGIGAVTAEKLIGTFGAEVLDALENRQRAIASVKGIGKKRAKMMCQSYREHLAYRDLLIFLQGNGMGPGISMRVYRCYGKRAMRLIKENPYRLAEEVRGIGFRTADRLALQMGIDPDSPERAKAGLLFLLNEGFSEGHLYLPRDMLHDRTVAALETTAEPVLEAYQELLQRDMVRLEGEAVYLAALHDLERFVADELAVLSRRAVKEGKTDLSMLLASVGKSLGFDLSDEQHDAVLHAFRHRLLAITGGPGTGKTTLVKALTEMARRLGLDVALASPTGRAAKRLQQATNSSAKTIHRLLEFNPENGGFQRNRNRPLDCDLLLIDESSMVDMALMGSLLDALPGKATLVLVGDADQLPSVGAGTVFRDIIASGVVPVDRLHHIYRQARGSLIVENAHRVLHGRMPQVPKKEEIDQGQDFFLMPEEDPAKIVDYVKLLVSHRIPARFQFDPVDDVQVLAPMHRGLAGVTNLNRELQALLNPAPGPRLKRGDHEFRVGDKVMQIRNDYQKNIYNGDIVRVVDITPREKSLVVLLDGEAISYAGDELADLQLAYASSIHKAQGSEYPAVIVVLAREHYIMCQRNLLYTAMTRGKALTVIIGSRRAIGRAVENDQVKRRFSRLEERLRQA